MKRLTLLFCMLLFAGSVFAQFQLEDGMSWTEELWSGGQGSRFGGGSQLYQFYLSGDSTVNGQDYKRLFANTLSSWSSYRSWSDEQYIFTYTDTIVQHGLVGLLRIDSLDRTVFLRTADLPASHHYHQIINTFPLTEEVPLHHFDLAVGDSVSYKYEFKVVQEVAVAQEVEGREVRIFWFNNYLGDPKYDYWIEGIGSVYGLFGAYTTNSRELLSPNIGFYRINLRCFESSYLKMPKPAGNPLLDSCYSNVTSYFDSINAPRILYNEERRRIREAQEEDEMEEQEIPTSLEAALDTLDILLYPNFLRRQDQTDQLQFKFTINLSPEQINQSIESIHLYDASGRYYRQVSDEDWASIILDQAFFLHHAGPGYYFMAFELTNGRKIVKPLILY